jgi:Legionella pneumophila major outer membrane protein precursor
MRIRDLIGVGTAVASLFASQPVVAGELPIPCCLVIRPPCDLCGEWAVGAHARYLAPIACPYGYAQTVVQEFPPSFDALSGRVQIVPCRPDWGFRVFGNYLKDCLFVGVSYQWFQATATKSVVADLLVIRGGGLTGPGKGTGQMAVEYQNVDVRAGTYFLRGCASTLYLYGNARWVDLSHRRTARLTVLTTGATQRIQEKSQLQGGAIGLGAGGEFDIWCGLGGFIDGNILGVIGSRSLKDVEFRGVAPGAPPQIRQEFYPSETCVIPELDFRIGLNYTYVCGCLKLEGEIGYEIDYFWHGSVFPQSINASFTDGFSGPKPVCEDLGFSGLFFGGRLVF